LADVSSILPNCIFIILRELGAELKYAGNLSENSPKQKNVGKGITFRS
jgi:hypothetical protein